MKTGDILLCSGNGFLSRRIIGYNRIVLHMRGQAAILSHVAMIGPTDGDVFEATTLNTWAAGGKGKRGVQTNSLLTWLQHYNGAVWVREQRPDAVTKAMQIRMQSRMCQLIGTPYENGIPGVLELMLAGIQLPWISEPIAHRLRTQNAVHCSESCGEVAKYAGILGSHVRTNKIPPAVWWDMLIQLDDFYHPARQVKTRDGNLLSFSEK